MIIPDFVPLAVSIIGILMAQSQIVFFNQITFGLIGTFLFIIGITGLLFYDSKRETYSTA
ncbi:MAG: hypothetical protein Q7S21_05475 [archaeon]|nr:hypothetical protein [archaeon]